MCACKICCFVIMVCTWTHIFSLTQILTMRTTTCTLCIETCAHTRELLAYATSVRMRDFMSTGCTALTFYTVSRVQTILTCLPFLESMSPTYHYHSSCQFCFVTLVSMLRSSKAHQRSSRLDSRAVHGNVDYLCVEHIKKFVSFATEREPHKYT